MSTPEANAAALLEFMNSTAPMSQVRENLNLPNGNYDLACIKLEPAMDDNGLLYLQGEFKVFAGPSCSPGIAQLAAAQIGNTHKERFYIGSKKDPKAALPETRLNAPGFSRLKGIARACNAPTNDQQVGQLVQGIVNKTFHVRIETNKTAAKQADGTSITKEYCNMGRNPMPVGLQPAKLDNEAATPGASAPPAAATDPAIAGAKFE